MVDAISDIKISICAMTSSDIINMKVDDNTTFLDVLKHINEAKYTSCSFVRSDTNTLNVRNVCEKIKTFVDDGTLKLFIISSVSPKNDFYKIQNILWIYQNELQHTVNIDGVDIINQGPIGSWIGFGRGSINCKDEEDNHLRNLIFIIYENDRPYAYNKPSFLKTKDENNAYLIAHMNKRFKQASYSPTKKTLYITKSNLID